MVLRTAPRIHKFFALYLTLSLLGCADGADAPILDTTEWRLNSPQAVSAINRLRVGDKIRVTVFGEQDLSGVYQVNASGNVALPLIGEIPARDKSIVDLRQSIVQKLRNGYLKSPRVAIEALSLRPIYVHGEVRGGGQFAFRSGLRLRDAIALAGGFTYRANKSYVLIVRTGKQGEFKTALDSNIQLLPGDNIRVPERYF